MSFTGLAMSDIEDQRRKAFMETAKSLFDRVWQHALVDGAADQMAKKFMHEAMPPYLTESESCENRVLVLIVFIPIFQTKKHAVFTGMESQ